MWCAIHRFPPAIISHAVWLSYRFTLSFRDVEDLLAQRGITVSYGKRILEMQINDAVKQSQRLRVSSRK